jgi:hypothetical protein
LAIDWLGERSVQVDGEAFLGEDERLVEQEDLVEVRAEVFLAVLSRILAGDPGDLF